MTPPLVTLVIVPGLGDSGPDHWQTLWERKYGAARVRQDDPQTPLPEPWSARLQQVIADTPGELVLVGHSAGALTIVDWAARYGVPERVKGALLVAPPDARSAAPVAAFASTPLQPLPFPAMLVASENDPHLSFGRAEELADVWDAQLVSAGEAGHINVASGHGDWPDGEVLLSEALHAWTPPEISRF